MCSISRSFRVFRYTRPPRTATTVISKLKRSLISFSRLHKSYTIRFFSIGISGQKLRFMPITGHHLLPSSMMYQSERTRVYSHRHFLQLFVHSLLIARLTTYIPQLFFYIIIISPRISVFIIPTTSRFNIYKSFVFIATPPQSGLSLNNR